MITKHKKKLTILISAFLIYSSLSASDVQLYDRNSDEYQLTRRLAIAAGVVTPSTSVPVTESELVLTLDRIDRSKLPLHLRESYDELYALFNGNEKKQASFEIPMAFSPQLFLSKDGNNRNDFFLPYRDEKPFASFGVRFSFSDYIFMEGYIPLQNAPSKTAIPTTSLSFLAGKETTIYGQMPNLARGSVGNDTFAVISGRTRHGMGDGYTGNLMIGDNFAYQELLEFKFLSNIFTYNISITHFDSQDENGHMLSARFDGQQQTRVVSRFEVNFVDRVRATLNLSTMYYASTSFDPRWIIPFMISHSYYNYSEDLIIKSGDEANNMLSLELDCAFTKNFKGSFQLAMDQFQLFNEGNKVPNAFGFLLNFSYIFTDKEWDLEMYAEAAYTMPYMYLAPKYNVTLDEYGNIIKKEPNYNYDYYAGYSRYEESWLDDMQYTGYIYGPDTIVSSLGIKYQNYPLRLKGSTTITYVVQGENDIEDAYDTFADENRVNIAPTGTPHHILKFREELSLKLDIAEFFFGTELQFHFNDNHKKNIFRTNIQMYIGTTISFCI